MIEIREVCKSFDRVRALDNFNLDARAGEIVGLVGPNGAGKTTLIKVLASLLPADAGHARIGGIAVTRHNPAVRRTVGYLADVAGIYQDMRVREFLEFFADAFHLRVPERDRAIESALRDSGLAKRQDAFVEQLSLGLKQRLLLAKTMLHSPRVLLLDEPAAGLDPIARTELRRQLKDWMSSDRAALVSSHILSDLEDICTKVVLIAGGRNVGTTFLDKSASSEEGERVIVEVEVISDPEAAAGVVALYKGAHVRETDGTRLLVEVENGTDGVSDLLSHLVRSQVKIFRYSPQAKKLDKVYRDTFGGQIA